MSRSPIDTIVYVEDSDDAVFLARRVLKRLHPTLRLLHFDRFEDLITALDDDRLIDPPTTLMVLDLNLKLSNGNDGIRQLRARPALAGMPMGICTGSTDPADQRDSVDAGADFFIRKPLLPDGLEAICDAVSGLEWVPDSEDGFALQRTDQ